MFRRLAFRSKDPKIQRGKQEMNRVQKLAFSLAEILVTLGIISIVAAMTLPALNNSIKDAQFKAAYKKAFAIANQAILSANQQDLIAPTSGEGDYANHLNNFLSFMAQFKVEKKCITNNNSECWEATGEKARASADQWYPKSSSYAFIDSSGTAWSMYYAGFCIIFVDTNGFKTPNQWGKDRFILNPATSSGVSAAGTPIRFLPEKDNGPCWSPNKCSSEKNYYGTSWLYN